MFWCGVLQSLKLGDVVRTPRGRPALQTRILSHISNVKQISFTQSRLMSVPCLSLPCWVLLICSSSTCTVAEMQSGRNVPLRTVLCPLCCSSLIRLSVALGWAGDSSFIASFSVQRQVVGCLLIPSSVRDECPPPSSFSWLCLCNLHKRVQRDCRGLLGP